MKYQNVFKRGYKTNINKKYVIRGSQFLGQINQKNKRIVTYKHKTHKNNNEEMYLRVYTFYVNSGRSKISKRIGLILFTMI